MSKNIYFVCETVPENVHGAIAKVNRLGVQNMVFQFLYTTGGLTQVVFGFDSYGQYEHFCAKMKRTPVPTNIFFGESNE